MNPQDDVLEALIRELGFMHYPMCRAWAPEVCNVSAYFPGLRHFR
jgi:hypothetical protein